MRVAVVTPVLAHYRRNLFLKLDKHPVAQFVHFSSVRSASRIDPMDPAELNEFVPVRNVSFGPFLWQVGVLRAAFGPGIDSIIFTGNVKYLSTWVGAALARLRGKRVYLWTIGWHRAEVGLKRLVRLCFYRLANRLMVYGDREKALVGKHGYPLDRVDVVYNSVTDVGDVRVVPFGPASRRMSIGAVVRLNYWKRLDLLLSAVAILRRRGMELDVVFGGDGPERERLHKLAADLQVRTVFLGPLHDSRSLSSFYERVSLTVIPSAAGLTTIQSLAYGVPVVTDDDDDSQMPEASAVVPGRTGSRFVAGDSESLADEIASWVERLSSDLVGGIAYECRQEVANRWNPDVQADRMIASLQR